MVRGPVLDTGTAYIRIAPTNGIRGAYLFALERATAERSRATALESVETRPAIRCVFEPRADVVACSTH